MKYNKVLVTGGCGFIGSNFIRYLLDKYLEIKVINLDNLTYAGNIENLADFKNDKRYELIIGDIADADLVEKLVEQVDIVINFAAESHVDRSILDCQKFVKTNILGTQVLLEACRKNGLKRYHQISTDEVYGTLGETGSFSEKTNYNPRNPYSASKAGADHLTKAYFFTHRLPITISNCSNNYGKYHFPEKLIPCAITNLLEGKKIPLHGDGKDIRDWVHVLDHCEAIDLIVDKGTIGETYCIGGDAEYKNIEVVNLILSDMGMGTEYIEYVGERSGHDTRYSIDHTKITCETGWVPKITFEEGLKDTIKWYTENPAWWKPLKNKASIRGTPVVFDLLVTNRKELPEQGNKID